MISVVTVYNNQNMLSDILLKSLRKQSVKYELITLNNIDGNFKSAAEALNYGGSLASGKYIMFVHQDVELNSSYWLESAEQILDKLPDVGIAGSVGMSLRGNNFEERFRGYFADCGEVWFWCKNFSNPIEVQTLDECVLIIPRHVFSKTKFDKNIFDGWHCYGADYCLMVKQLGLKAYVIPGFINHLSPSSNIKDLYKYQKRLYLKYINKYKYIYTTCGMISGNNLIFLKFKYIFLQISVLRPIYKFFKKNRTLLNL